MRANINISLYVGIAFTISLVLLFSFFIMYEKGILTIIQINEIEIGDKNTVFLLGTSYVATLNATHIQNILEENGFNMAVIHPTHSRITPTLEKLNDIISNKPQLIVYGIGFMDIGFMPVESDDYKEDCTFSSIYDMDISKNIEHANTSNVDDEQKFEDVNIFSQNPQDMTMEIIQNIVEYKNAHDVYRQNITNNYIELNHLNLFNKITPNKDLAKTISHDYCMHFDTRDTELNNLDIIFAEFYKNNIDVIVFITPYPEPYLNELPQTLKTELISNIKTVSEKYNFQVHDISDKFKNKNIFSDHTHVASNPKSSIYSETISSLIMNCINHVICK